MSCSTVVVSSVAYFSNRRRRRGSRGSGQSLHASIRHRSTVAAIQRHASKRWRISKRSGPHLAQPRYFAHSLSNSCIIDLIS